MRFSVRSFAVLAVFLVPALLPVVASAQGAGPAQAPTPLPPPPGGGAPAGGGTDPGAEKPKPPADAKSTSNIGGVSFNDKPARRVPTVRTQRVGRAGPLATFPGFEQLPDGGSRLFVHLTQTVPVEERRATGSVTYVLRGAHLRVNNDANALVTVHFNTPVFRARLFPQGNDLLFVLELRSAAAPAFKLQANQDKSATLQIDFAKGDFLSGDGRDVLPREPGPRTRRRGARPNPNQNQQAPDTTDDTRPSDQGPPP